MQGFLAYKEPGGQIQSGRGDWQETNFSKLNTDGFFVSDFKKDKCYVFEKESSNAPTYQDVFHFRAKNNLFFIDRSEYINDLRTMIRDFSESGLRKAVISRILHMPSESEQSPLDIFNELTDLYGEEAFIYLISSPFFGTWVGATPEVLLKGEKSGLNSMALAGTKHREEDPWTEKEYEEQKMVADYVKDTILRINPESFRSSELKTVKSGSVYHLRKDFFFDMNTQKWPELINQLHPTPAVCGLPADDAQKRIRKIEKHDRSLYTGLIGFRENDVISLYVNLRCMEILEDGYALYVGGGITADSVPEKEWEETNAKSQTLKKVIR
ncbi:MAG: chorismate-binding protein [Brumimicrobium sp.]|nr:chorismate-binding protein [Brumimicrobium sp.]